MTYTFTFHIVNIKQLDAFVKEHATYVFTFHIVNIKRC